MTRQQLLHASVWLFTLFCIMMMFAGPVGQLARQLRSIVNGMP